MLRYCANLKAIRYESTSLNRIVADKSHRVIAALPDDYKSNTKPLSYRTNDENSRSDNLLTFKCELLFQMTEQSYSSLFTLTIGFIPMSIKRLLCDFDYKPMSLVKN